LAIWTAHWAALLGILTAGTLIMAAALRGIVYFRDVYRATNNGVPDLVEVIRQIDLEAVKGLNRLRAEGESHQRKRIALSFIGHSMGGLVVVSAIRVLSDVFDPDAILTKLSGAPRSRTAGQAADDQVSGTIGHVFDLMRFVLASPDIPGETLLANRANFLASSLRRFKEAYLFSSEGDGVLRSISTIVNYFTFPTRSRNYGYRLGNAEILTSDFSKPVAGDVLKRVRVGRKTLAELRRRRSAETRARSRGHSPISTAPTTKTASPQEGCSPRLATTSATIRTRTFPCMSTSSCSSSTC
jgi:Putative serine esterase (DUF676)